MPYDNNVIVLTYLLQTYHKFIFYDSIVSIINTRDFRSIKMLYLKISDALLYILNNGKFCDSVIEKYKNGANEIINAYLENKENCCDDELKNSIQHVFKNKALTEDSVQSLLKEDAFLDNFQKFVIAYCQLHRYANGILSDLLTEFHNAMSHIITALLHKQNSNNEVYVRNIAKAVSHLKRGKKDAYKIIIRCLYPVIEKYPNIKKEFRKEFIIIRCNEIDYLSNIEKHEEIENSIQNIAEKYLDKLAMDSNSENNKNFKTILKDFFLYKERI